MATLLLAIYIALIFVRPMDWFPLVKGMRLVNYTAIATLLVAFPRIMRDHPRLWREVPQARLAYALLIAASLSWIYPPWLQGIVDTFQEFGKIIVLFLLVLLLGRDWKRFRVLLWCILLCVLWMAIHGILQIHTGTGFGNQRPFLRGRTGIYQIIAFGIFHDPNDLCLAFIIALPLLWAVFRASPSGLARGASLLMMPVIGYAAWLTQSRGGIVGIFGMLAAYAMGRTKGIRRYIIASLSITLVTFALPARAAQLGSIDFGRVNAWGDGMAAFRASPLFGVGWANFTEISGNRKAAHNSYVEALTELGLFGYIPWFLLIYLTVIHMRRVLRVKVHLDRSSQYYMTGLFSGLTGYLTAIYFLSRASNHVLYVLLGICICQTWLACRTPELRSYMLAPLKRDLQRGTLLALGSIVFLYISIRILNVVGGRV